MRVQLLARHAGLDGAVEVLGADPQDAVHLRQVDAHPAAHRSDVAFQRRAGAEGDDRHARLGAARNDLGDLLGRAGEDDGVGRGVGMVRLAAAVLLARRRGGGEPRSEPLLETGERRRDVAHQEIGEKAAGRKISDCMDWMWSMPPGGGHTPTSTARARTFMRSRMSR